MEPVRIAIIGCGFIAEKHVRSIAEAGTDDAELIACCDIDPSRLAAFMAKTGLDRSPAVRSVTDIKECLRMPDVDLVVIATSGDTHASLSLEALRAGKHVLVEKPLALSLRDARAAADEARRNRRILAVSLQARYLPQMLALKRAYEEGRFGQLLHGAVSMRWNRNMEYYSSSPWRDSWARGGGLFMNQCIHYIDLLQWIMGPAVSVYSEADTYLQHLHVENMGSAVIRFESGAIGVIEASSCVLPASQLTSLSVFGANGSVTLEGGKLDQIRSWQFVAGENGEKSQIPIPPPAPGEISHTPLYQDLIAAIRNKTEPLVSAEKALHSLETVMAIYKSIAERQPVKLPLREFDMKVY